MKAHQLILRCMAEQDNDQWVAQCLDLSLAAQADSYEEAKSKLDDMIHEDVSDALVGEDREFAESLMMRKAPLDQWIKYYWYKFVIGCCNIKTNVHRSFTEIMPMVPGNHKPA